MIFRRLQGAVTREYDAAKIAVRAKFAALVMAGDSEAFDAFAAAHQLCVAHQRFVMARRLRRMKLPRAAEIANQPFSSHEIPDPVQRLRTLAAYRARLMRPEFRLPCLPRRFYARCDHTAVSGCGAGAATRWREPRWIPCPARASYRSRTAFALRHSPSLLRRRTKYTPDAASAPLVSRPSHRA